MNVERKDFIHQIEDYSTGMKDNFMLKSPVTYGVRVLGIEEKIHNATGIAPHKLDICRVSISPKQKVLLG